MGGGSEGKNEGYLIQLIALVVTRKDHNSVENSEGTEC